MMACTITVKSVEGTALSWKLSWGINNYSSFPEDPYFQVADLVFEAISEVPTTQFSFTDAKVFLASSSEEQHELLESDLDNAESFKFLLDTLSSTLYGWKWIRRTAKLIAPRSEGNIIRSDIIPLRLSDIESIETVKSLATPLERFSGRPWNTATDFSTLLYESAGGILLRPRANTEIEDLDSQLVQMELHNRISFSWIAKDLKPKTVAFLEGSTVHPTRGGTAETMYGAAQALGIEVVVLAVEGHWLQGEEYAHWRKTLVPIKFGFDAEFPSRIVDAVKASGVKIDGIYTAFDCFQVAVTTAAEELGLPCEPSSAFEIATNKYKTSAFEGHVAFKATSAENALEIAKTKNLPWPIIVKPCNGWGSEDVFKVDSAEDLSRQVGRMNTARHGAEFVMEHYCDGPEVDVNIVLYDSEILFFEISDEYPKGAENGTQDSFHEMDTCSPSQLPVDEKKLLKEHFHSSLLRLGFKNGIFHCEARMENSRLVWNQVDSGIYELQPKTQTVDEPPSVWVIEINPRPPGMKATAVIETSYGVEYWGLTMLIALKEDERVRALANQFRNGAQYHADMIFISAAFDDSKEGIWQSGDVTAEALKRLPRLAKNVSNSMTFIQKGDKVPNPSSGVNTFVAYANLFSRRSRREVLEIANEIRKEISIEYS